MILLGGHDPYLDQRDRAILQQDPGLQKKIWRLSANPGAVVCRGEVVGIWTGKKKGKGMEIQITLWKEVHHRQGLLESCGAIRGVQAAEAGEGWVPVILTP